MLAGALRTDPERGLFRDSAFHHCLCTVNETQDNSFRVVLHDGDAHSSRDGSRACSSRRTTESAQGKNIPMETLRWKRTLLNRVIRWDPVLGRAELEADTRLVAMVLRDLGLETATPAVTLVAERPKCEELLLLAGAKPLNADDAALHSAVAMRVNCLSLDRRDLSCAASSLARGMKNPTTKDLEELKRVERYLRGRPVGAIRFGTRTLPGVLEVSCDADHARLGITQVPIWNGCCVEVTLVEAW